MDYGKGCGVIPGLDLWRLAAYGLVVLLVVGSAAGFGYHKGVQRLWDYQAEQAREAVKIVVKQGEVTEKVVTKYIKVKAEAVIIEKVVEKEVIKYADANPGNCLDVRWGELHDASAGSVPDPAGAADGKGRAPTAAQALQTVTANYAGCIRTADRLDALQSWVAGQKDIRP